MNLIKETRKAKNIKAKEMAIILHMKSDDYLYFEEHYITSSAYLCFTVCELLNIDLNSIF